MPGMRVVERLGVLMPLRIAVCGSKSFIIEASDHTTPASDGPMANADIPWLPYMMHSSG
jgi:hypothetical protein